MANNKPNLNQLTLDTKVNITTLIGKKTEEYNTTLKKLKFTQDDLDKYTPDEIEEILQKRFAGWNVEWVDFE